MFQAEEHQHLRHNPLTNEWVLVCPHRTKRPWLGQTEDNLEDEIPSHDPQNPLCPGTTNKLGRVTPEYTSTYVFDNDYPALTDDSPDGDELSSVFFKRKTARGSCKVMCFHPHSNVTLPLMTLEEIKAVISEWIQQYKELSEKYTWVQIFENKGAIMGCSNPHPHCQIWSSSFLPNEARKEDETQMKYYEEHGTSMLMDYVKLETKERHRIVAENEHWIVLVPYWAIWPYELLLLPKDVVHHLSSLSSEQQESLARIMKEFLTKYDNLFKCSFPYSMGWHGAPAGPDSEGKSCCHWQLHAHYYPPLLRSSTVKKFLVGYEMLAQAQRDLTAEKAAATLRQLPAKHYKTL